MARTILEPFCIQDTVAMLSGAPTVGLTLDNSRNNPNIKIGPLAINTIPFWLHSDWKCPISPISYPLRVPRGLILQYDPTAGLWTLQPVLSRDKVPGGPPENNNKKEQEEEEGNLDLVQWGVWSPKDDCWLCKGSSKIEGKPQPVVHGVYLERVLVQPIWETGTTREGLPQKLASYEAKKPNLCSQHFSHAQPTPSRYIASSQPFPYPHPSVLHGAPTSLGHGPGCPQCDPLVLVQVLRRCQNGTYDRCNWPKQQRIPVMSSMRLTRCM